MAIFRKFRVMEAVQGIPRTDLLFRLEILKTIKRIFLMYPFTRDVFRLSGGYVSLVSMIVSLENAFTDNSDFGGGQTLDPDTLKQTLTQVLELVLIVLMESMRDNDTNQQYFKKVVGYDALGNALELTGALTRDGIGATFFGLLFSFMIQDETMRGLFTGEHMNVLVDTGYSLDYSSILQHIDHVLNDSMADVYNPDMAVTILQLQQSMAWDEELGYAVLVALYALVRGNRQNQIKLNRCGLALKALERIYPRGPNEAHPASHSQMVHQENDKSRNILIQIVKKLVAMGVGDKELRYLFQSFGTDGYLADLEDPAIDGLLDLILHGTTRSRWPNFIQLDVSNDINKRPRPTASLEILRLTNFPPPSPGYTITMWIHIEQWNKISNMTVWSLWDGQRMVFHVYIDAATGNLHIRSGASKVDCKFDSFEFKPGYWYHIGLVHGKSRIGASLSTVTLFVNGIWMEQARCAYMAPGLQGYLKCIIGGDMNDDGILSTTGVTKKDHHRLIWDLGPTYIMADTLDGDLMNLYFHLSARYKSLFQDSLRQFQTYDASTALFLNLRGITKRRNMNKSTLANVMRGATTHSFLPENKILLAIIAGNALAYGKQTGLTLTGLSQERLLRIENDDTMKHMVLNSAIPKIADAIDGTAFTGFLVGNPGVAFPFGLDESIWKIGGCAIGLNFIHRSETAPMLIKSTHFLVEIIQYSWRNSEDMERCHGYEIMANILKQKRDIITVDLLELLLQFIGKKNGQPEESTISNPYAYRSIILNFEIWKKTSIPVQKAHLEQFILFMETSNQHAFNLKRLLKVHIVKKMLLAFRMNIYAKELIPNVVNALKAVTKSSWTTESIRAVATFLASTAPNGKKRWAKKMITYFSIMYDY
ncbi:hypothetical protein BC941DRAFT_459196 [Chlamydoabsidia padenii]|nr:hypothetical protein BC941DRAFT_459196 [Chlamydoabsidia padenii]